VVNGGPCINGDPGQSFFHNHGGDEGGIYPGSLLNSRGNNTPG
jgi:hypothetical protein